MTVAATTWRDDAAWPDVDVVMPIRNEEAHLEAAIESVRAQEYPGRLRVFLGVAPSDDETESVAARVAAESDDVIIVPNPSGVTPAGLNAAIRAGSAPVIVRVDGHSLLSAGYVRRSVEVLRSSGAGNVGGRQVPRPQTPFEDAVATATTSWLGTGGATYRVGGEPGPVDTVYLGVFDRTAIESVGLFDERLVRNQDYELNIRLRRAGHVVWFDPTLWVGYRPRGSWRSLARQYYEYGFWKHRVLRMHPSSLRLRQLAPPIVVGGAVVGLLIGIRRPRALIVPIAYAALLLTQRSRFRSAPVAAVIHLAWSWGLLDAAIRRSSRSLRGASPGGNSRARER